MIGVSVWCHEWTDTYLRRVAQLGADCVDQVPVPQVDGFPDLNGMLGIRKTLRSWGLDWNRLSLPQLSEAFMSGANGSSSELTNACRWMRVYGEAGVPIIRADFANDRFNWMNHLYTTTHRGGYEYGGRSIGLAKSAPGPPSAQQLQRWWDQFCVAYDRLVPLAEQYDTKLVMHPSDAPHPDSPFGGLGFHRLIDAYPSRHVGYLYCVGTRSEAGGLPLVLDEIHNYGRKGRLCAIHFRNVRGSFATAGAYEEVLLDDGDMNMFKVIQALYDVGFDGCLNADHYPDLEGDDDGPFQSLAYCIGYMKGLVAAAAV